MKSLLMLVKNLFRRRRRTEQLRAEARKTCMETFVFIKKLYIVQEAHRDVMNELTEVLHGK